MLFQSDRDSFLGLALDANRIQQRCVGNTARNTGGAVSNVGKSSLRQIPEGKYFYLSDPTHNPIFLSIKSHIQMTNQELGTIPFPPQHPTNLSALLGEAGRLSIQLVEQAVYTTCTDNPAPSYASCRSVLDVMPYDDRERKFGPKGAPGVEIETPFLLPSGMYP